MDRESDGKVGGELLDELFSAFEDLETHSAGILQFLKAKGLATDEELAPHLQQAADASNVRWLAARLRMDALLAAAIHDAEEEFARKIEERAKVQGKMADQEQEPGEIQKKPASNENTNAREADAAREDQGQLPSAAKQEAAEAKKETGKADIEVAEAEEKTAAENEPADAAENDPDQKAA